MKVIWLIGAPPSFIEKMQTTFAHERFQKSYLLRTTDKIDEIPDLHLTHSASVFLIDALMPENLGFKGVETLRKLSCKGPTFLIGEPAATSIVEAFEKHEIAGFFPTWEKMDIHSLAGSIHNLFHLDQEISLDAFLAHPGRSTKENISSGEAFAQFSNKLAQFVQRFGIEASVLKRFLMGLCLPHVRQEGGTQIVEAPFVIYYGVDQERFVAGVRGFSRGQDMPKLLSGFGGAIAAAKQGQTQDSLFQEFYHVAKSCGNLQVFCGNLNKEAEDTEPLFLMGVIGFPGAASKKIFSQVTLIRCKHRLEMNQDEASLPLKVVEGASQNETGATAKATSVPGPVRSLQEEQLLSLLSQAGPVVTGHTGSTQTTETPVKQEYLSSAPASAEVQSQLEELRTLNRALADDVKRLLKDRREPTGEKELKDALEESKKKVKSLQQEMLKYEDQIKDREGQIEALREELKIKKVA